MSYPLQETTTWSDARARIAQQQLQVQTAPKERRPAAFKQLARLASAFVREGFIPETEAREVLEDISERVGLVEDIGDAVAIIINDAMRRANALCR